MKRYCVLLFCALTLSACVSTSIDNNDNVNSNNTCSDNDEPLIDAVGPAHDADVRFADADVWFVPPLDINIIPDKVIWTLSHSEVSAHAYVRRFCNHQTPEPYLWLREPKTYGGELIAILRACEGPDEFYSTVELAYNGTRWIGLAATGTATLVPPLP